MTQKTLSFVKFLTAVSFALLAFVPLLSALTFLSLGYKSTTIGIFSFVWPIILVLFFIYARQTCAPEGASYTEGLLCVTHALLTRGVVFALVLVFPTLLFVFFASVVISALCRVTLRRQTAPRYYHKLIGFFYRHRQQR